MATDIKRRIRPPNVVHVVDTEMGMFEQVGGLIVDLEWVVPIEQVDVEQLSHTCFV